jgi:hypothetical protein
MQISKPKNTKTTYSQILQPYRYAKSRKEYCCAPLSRVGIVGKFQANERDKLKLANSGKFELYPDVKPINYYFLFFGYNSSIQSWCYQPS